MPLKQASGCTEPSRCPGLLLCRSAGAGVDTSAYTDESAKAYADALAAAKEAIADPNATQEQVDAALQALKAAEAALAPRPAPEPQTVAEEGWKQADDGSWSYTKDGAKVTGWLQDADGRWYHFDADGVMSAGWLLDADGSWYYLSQAHDGSFGSLASGWLLDAGHWYLLSTAHDGSFGRMLTGWQLIGGDWYYLREHTGDPLGSCALDTVIDGWRVDASGRWVA